MPDAAASLPDSTRAAYEFSTPQKVYLWLSCFSLACLLIADIVGVKLFRVPFPGNWSFTMPFSSVTYDSVTHTCGMLTFPVTFLITDLLNEYYGKKAAGRVVWIGFAMAMFVFVVVNVAQAMPAWDVPFNVKQEAFDSIFGSAKVMYVASLMAYLVGNFCDIAVFGVFKRLTKGRFIWLRATGSTVVSQMVDSFIVTYLAFGLGRTLFAGGGETMPFGEIIKTAATGYTLKFVIAIGITPIIYLGHRVMRSWFGLTPMPAA
ncbi:MAG: queuosine precursor transporter [Phycisphaerales bacterium]|nr:queuosine precursor transporter [Phycisphaerales bacterium]